MKVMRMCAIVLVKTKRKKNNMIIYIEIVVEIPIDLFVDILDKSQISSQSK